MKKIFVLASLFIAAAIVSCEKNDNIAKESKGIKVTLFTPDADTRAIVTPNGDNYSVTWKTEAKSEKVRVYYPTNKANNGKDDLDITVNETGTSGSFWLNETKTAGATKVWVLYPLSAGVAGATNNLPYKAAVDELFAAVATTQTCGTDAPDETQTLMFASMEYPEGGGSVQGKFEHIVAYGKFNFTGLKGTKITSVKFTVNDDDARLAIGVGAFSAEEKKFVKDETEERTPTNTITINCPEGGIAINGEENIWFAALPSYDATYSNVTIAVTTDTGTYTKNVTDAKLQLNCGKVRPIKVDMTDAQ